MAKERLAEILETQDPPTQADLQHFLNASLHSGSFLSTAFTYRTVGQPDIDLSVPFDAKCYKAYELVAEKLSDMRDQPVYGVRRVFMSPTVLEQISDQCIKVASPESLRSVDAAMKSIAAYRAAGMHGTEDLDYTLLKKFHSASDITLKSVFFTAPESSEFSGGFFGQPAAWTGEKQTLVKKIMDDLKKDKAEKTLAAEQKADKRKPKRGKQQQQESDYSGNEEEEYVSGEDD